MIIPDITTVFNPNATDGSGWGAGNPMRSRFHRQLEVMLTDLFERRIAHTRHHLTENNIDTFMVETDENRRYLSGFKGEDSQFDESAGVLFITDTRVILATDSRYDEQAAKEAPHCEIVRYSKTLVEDLPDILNTLDTRRMAFESNRMSVARYEAVKRRIDAFRPSIEFVPAKGWLENQRMIKDETEIAALKKALRLAESVFRDITGHLTLGMSEKEVAWLLEKGMRESGADALSFPVIVASGPNSALPHAQPQSRKLRTGEPILIDWGAKLDGYCSDISRTFVVGRPDDMFKKVFQTVWEAQRKAIDAVKPGISSRAVDAVAREYIDRSEFKGKFGHGLGHGTGLAIHENPRLSPLKDTPLEPGMVFTVEPGIYIPGWGGVRLENMAVVTDSGVDILNDLETEISID